MGYSICTYDYSATVGLHQSVTKESDLNLSAPAT